MSRLAARSAGASPRLAALLLTGILLLAGCGSKQTGVYVDPTFTARTLAAEPITVLGVVSLAAEDGLTERETLRELLFAELEQRRADLRWADPSTAWIRLGLEETQQVLDVYRTTARFTADQLASLSVIDGHARYALLGRVDLDLVSYDYERQEREVSGRWVLTVEPRARREMSVGFDVFDLREQRLVFTVHLQRTASDRGLPVEVEMLETTPTEADYERAIRDVFTREPLPEPPSRGEMLAIFAREVAEALPGARGGR